MEAIPLHLPSAHITADKIAPIAQEHAVPDGVDVWWGELGDACVAGVLALAGLPVAHQLLADLCSHSGDGS